jgi:hypothetical protein
MAKKKQKFAKTIFVSWIEADQDYRAVEDAAQNFAEAGENVEVGEYQLVAVRKVKTEIKIS